MTVAAEHEPGAAEEVVPVAPTTVAEPEPSGALSSEDQDIHRKAQRFARLLVDEVKLYNQARVAEGRKHKDLYDRLKEAIEKSRSTFQKRYGNTVAASGDYFQHELVRSLAEDDVSIMGANFRH
jgi:DNA replication initiation complex subunit (GINS family)